MDQNKNEEQQMNSNEETQATNLDETIENQDVDANEVADFEELLKAEKDKFLRLYAEFENYKRRTSKERLDLIKTANEDVLSAMLPILDDFDRACAQLSVEESEGVGKGLLLIVEKFRGVLVNKGLTLVDVKIGDVFDADLSEAITSIPALSDDLKGKIIDVVEKGYYLGEKIIRYPKVVVGQ